jgi:RAB protein geranylgeranyltransferase component A
VFEGCSTEFDGLNSSFEQLINSGSDFKYFNIDVQPKLLYSTSPTVELMQQADMDQYMDFKAIVTQYYYHDKKF